MSNETISNDSKADAVDIAAPVAVTPVKPAIEAVETVAPKAEVAAKPVARRRARKAPAAVAEAVKKINKRANRTARRAAKPAPTVDATPIERTTTMSYDFTKPFGGLELPGTDKFQTLFADAGVRGQDFVAKGQKVAEEVTDLAKANVEALVEAGRIAATGAKCIGQELLSTGRDGLEQTSDVIKTLADAKSPTEFFQLQSELVRASFDRMVAESSKITEQMVKLAGEAIQPISNRASLNAERVNELMA